LFRGFQNLNRFVVIDPSEGLSLASSHGLIEIQAHPGIDIGSLAAILEMPRTSVATIVLSLVKQRLVSVSKSKHDARHRSLKITKRGATLLARTDPEIDAHLAWVLSPLQTGEQAVLREFFRKLADGMGSPTCHARSTEHPFRHQLRRATRALRLIHADFMGTKLGSPEWQVLAKLKEAGTTISISQLAAELQLYLSTATTICARLKERGYIRSAKNPADRRVALISLTTAGDDFMQRMESEISNRVSHALEKLPTQELQYELKVFERLIEAKRG
jgi:DNA-binding MarR family transcriptional regulator